MTGRRHGHGDCGEDLAGLEGGVVGALVELGRGDLALAARTFELVARPERQHQRRHVVARIAVGDIAADGAAIAHLRIGDQVGRLLQDGQRLGDHIGGDDLVLGGHGADDDGLGLLLDAA